MTVARAVAAAFVASGGLPAVASTQVVTRRTLEVAGTLRTYLLSQPSAVPSRAGAPLIFVFHGGSGTARGIARHTRMTDVASREGFFVVYPQGIGRRWNDGRGIHAAYDDVGFVRALLDTLQREFAVDRRRIYATGISNGGVFVHRLACELPGTFAAIAPVAAGFPARLESRCGAASPIGVLTFQGTADPLMPFRGSAVAARRGAVLSAERSAAFWARIDDCEAAPSDSLLPDRSASDRTRAWRVTYVGCRTGRPVVFYRIEGGGHTWPGGPAAGASVGRVSQEVDATAAIVRFFDRVR